MRRGEMVEKIFVFLKNKSAECLNTDSTTRDLAHELLSFLESEDMLPPSNRKAAVLEDFHSWEDEKPSMRGIRKKK